ncbi:MAG: COX15/CtaA family protein [Tagaea sp.]|nr:COX15/CtaA family protein [Tagaea sp.]
MTAIAPRPADRAVAIWLLICAAMIFAMVVIGGVTRLTESGLSIVEWRPVTGALPPLSDAQWQAEFDKYRQIDQYRQLNAGMSLAEFKVIFFWEWFHRFWGRLIGLVFFVPFVWFLWTGAVRGRLAAKLAGIFALGGLQGFVGWWMVASGLRENMVAVSHLRLAAHLGLALIIHAAILWVALDLLRGKRGPSRERQAGLALSALVFATILAGALVAGLDAGMTHNSFPLMDGRLFPAGYFDLDPAWRNFFDNVVAVQFNHRWLGIACAVLACAYAWRVRPVERADRLWVLAPAYAAFAQAALGIATLLFWVPLPLAAAHQAGAVILLSCALAAAHATGKR